MRKIFLAIILFISLRAFSQDYMPEEFPADMKVTYTATKGLMNSSETIFLSADSCYYETIFQDISNRFTFYTTSKNMKELFEIFNKYEIEKITTKKLEREAPERVGDNLLIQWGQDFYSILISNSGNFILNDKWLNNWRKIVKNVKKHAKVELDNRARTFTIKFDEALKGKRVAMYLNNEFLYDNNLPEISSDGFFLNLQAVPGTYYLKIVPGDTGAAQEFKVEIAEGKEINLGLDGNSITIK
jgi:hypothetical protein